MTSDAQTVKDMKPGEVLVVPDIIAKGVIVAAYKLNKLGRHYLIESIPGKDCIITRLT